MKTNYVLSVGMIIIILFLGCTPGVNSIPGKLFNREIKNTTIDANSDPDCYRRQEAINGTKEIYLINTSTTTAYKFTIKTITKRCLIKKFEDQYIPYDHEFGFILPSSYSCIKETKTKYEDDFVTLKPGEEEKLGYNKFIKYARSMMTDLTDGHKSYDKEYYLIEIEYDIAGALEMQNE